MTAPTPSPQTPRALLEALHTAHDGASGSKCYEAGMALIAARDASLTAPLREEVEDAKGALEDAAAHEDNDTASVADRIATLAEERDFFRSAWFAVLDALYPHRLPDDQFDPKDVARDITDRDDREERAEAENARLRAALQPFADARKRFEADTAQERIFVGHYTKREDWIAAAKALAPEGGK